MSEATDTVPAGDFYQEYHGHRPEHLETVCRGLRRDGARLVFLAGDSSLDNKHWLFDSFAPKAEQLSRPSGFVAQALNGYEALLRPPLMVKDVCYFLNRECQARTAGSAQRTIAVNTAVEESCLSDREVRGLLPQDDFIRTHIREDDILVVDVGGNDVALKPTSGVIMNMALLLYCTPTLLIKNLPFAAPGLYYFLHMFRVRLRRYIEQLIEVKRPKKVVVCMLYFLDERSGGSWADGVLSQLGYDTNPEKLQAVIRQVYHWGVSWISIPGVEVVPMPLFEVLDGKNTDDYVQRVEPSVQGGEKMARALAEQIFA